MLTLLVTLIAILNSSFNDKVSKDLNLKPLRDISVTIVEKFFSKETISAGIFIMKRSSLRRSIGLVIVIETLSSFIKSISVTTEF